MLSAPHSAPSRILFRFTGGASVLRRSVILLSIFAVATTSLLAIFLIQLRENALSASMEVLDAFAQLTEEQTARTFQSVDQTLQIAETKLTDKEKIDDELRALIQARPYLLAISITDRTGRVLYTSVPGSTGVDLSDRAYFVRHRDNPTLVFEIGIPVRSRSYGNWLIPASRGLRLPTGEFSGVIVGSINPLFFDRVWTIDKTVKNQATALWNHEGVLMMRTPFDERAMGTSLSSGLTFKKISEGTKESLFRTISLVDGQDRIVAFRQLALYPQLTLTASQSTSRALAAWSRIFWIVVPGWAASLLILGGLTLWLVREWSERRTTQKRYRLLFESNPLPMAVLHRDTRRFLAVNDAAIEQYGWSRSEALTMTADELILAEDAAKLPALRQQDREDRLQTVTGLRHRKKDGSVIEVEINARSLEFGDVPAVLMMAQDITARKRSEQARETAEHELFQAQERYRLIFEAAPYPVVVTDRETLRLLAVNDAVVNQYGWSRQELLTMTVSDFYAPEDLLDVASRRQDYSSETTRFIEGLRHRRKDGAFIDVEMAVRFIEYNGRSAALTIVADVSNRLRAQRARIAAEEQLRESQKLEAVGKLTGGVAHDFNNILMVIMANVDNVLEEADIGAELRSSIEQIGGAAERASQLTRQLLAFSRKQVLRPQQTNLNDMVVATGGLLRRTLGAHIEIESLLAEDLWITNTDRAQVEAALINLCVNARDAMPEGGRLLIETGNAVLDESYAAHNPEASAGDYVMLSVTDTGIGMAPDVQAKAFEPFFTTKDVGKGTGLGLSMVYGFVKQSKGHVTIYSEVGQGTSVKLYLPRCAPLAEEATVKPEAATPRGMERILVVEDEEQVRAVVVQQLRGLGYRVAEAVNGSEGLTALRAGQSYDLLLTDVIMPGAVSGKALADAAHELNPEMSILFMSGYSDDAISNLGVLNPGVTLLSKPFRKVDLAISVRRAIDQKRGSTSIS